MTNNSVAVVGVLYPLPKTFINDYIKSLESQSFKGLMTAKTLAYMEQRAFTFAVGHGCVDA